MKFLISLLLSFHLGYAISQPVSFSIEAFEKNKNFALVTKLSLKDSNSTVLVSSPPIITDEDHVYDDYKIILRVKTKKGYRKVKSSTLIGPTLSANSIYLTSDTPIVDTFFPMFYYSLKKGNTYKVKVVRQIKLNNYPTFIRSNWLIFKLTSDPKF